MAGASKKSTEIGPREMRAITRALSDPRRFAILKHIAAAAPVACIDLRQAFPVSAATLSHHLKELESAGLIATERRGKFLDVGFRRDTWKAYLAELRSL
ncbi:MAG: helix-turn-helix transcriptional regulator [Acidobacteria bacterium]|nr:helix-turn-helix transcriptional regulator [Acidobacteriota bacterium]